MILVAFTENRHVVEESLKLELQCVFMMSHNDLWSIVYSDFKPQNKVFMDILLFHLLQTPILYSKDLQCVKCLSSATHVQGFHKGSCALTLESFHSNESSKVLKDHRHVTHSQRSPTEAICNFQRSWVPDLLLCLKSFIRFFNFVFFLNLAI